MESRIQEGGCTGGGILPPRPPRVGGRALFVWLALGLLLYLLFGIWRRKPQ